MDPARTVLFDGAVAVKGGELVEIGDDSSLAERYNARQEIDARGKAVLPGLVDTHHHFLQNFLKGTPDDLPFPEWIRTVSSPCISMAVADYRRGNSELQRHATRIGCIEALRSGITCILNMEWATGPDVIDIYDESGIRVVHTLTLTDVDQWQSDGMLLPIDEALRLADVLCDRCDRSAGGRVVFRFGPACENSTSPGLLREVRERASDRHVGIHLHLAESKVGWDNIHRQHGKTPVAYMHDIGLLGPDVLAAHCIWITSEDRRILRETGTAVSYTPECHMKLALGVAPVSKLLAEGAIVSLGTDTCSVNDNMDMFEEMRSGIFLQRIANMDQHAVPAYRALEMATIGGARALGMADRIGSLEPGKRADLILVDLSATHLRPINLIVNNLVYGAHASDVSTVMVDGEILVSDGRLCRLNETDAVAGAEAYMLQRFRDAGISTSPFYRTAAYPEQ